MIRLEPLDSFPQMDQILNGRLALGILNRLVDDSRLDYLPVLLERVGIALPDRPRVREPDRGAARASDRTAARSSSKASNHSDRI